MTNERKRVAVVGDRISFNHSLASFLADEQTDVLVGKGSITRADCVVWAFDGLGDIEALFRVAQSRPTVAIGRETKLMTAIDAGVRGFVDSADTLDQIAAAVHHVLDGGSVIPPALLGTLLQYVVRRRRMEAAASTGLAELTERERGVYELALDGLRKDEIAERLFISPDTVRTHLQRIYRKLGIHSQTELMSTKGITEIDGIQEEL